MTQGLAFLCVTSVLCIVKMMRFFERHKTQRNARIGSDSIFASAALHLTNQFSEFYHNATDVKQGLRHIVNQPLHLEYCKYTLVPCNRKVCHHPLDPNVQDILLQDQTLPFLPVERQ